MALPDACCVLAEMLQPADLLTYAMLSIAIPPIPAPMGRLPDGPAVPTPVTACLLHSKPEHLQGYAWGDKDTFGLAFAVAGKAHMFTQVPVPPGGCESVLHFQPAWQTRAALCFNSHALSTHLTTLLNNAGVPLLPGSRCVCVAQGHASHQGHQ